MSFKEETSIKASVICTYVHKQNKIGMKKKYLITFSLIFFFSGLLAQEIIMDLGGTNYSGIFETEP